AFQQKCFEVFQRMRDEGKTIVFVTHDMGAVQRFCHRAMLLERGDMLQIGAPDSVAANYMELNFGREVASREEGEAERYGDRGAVDRAREPRKPVRPPATDDVGDGHGHARARRLRGSAARPRARRRGPRAERTGGIGMSAPSLPVASFGRRIKGPSALGDGDWRRMLKDRKSTRLN